ncbi:MAG: lysophospholipid acyltransferase family protein [Nitrospirota bacterium]
MTAPPTEHETSAQAASIPVEAEPIRPSGFAQRVAWALLRGIQLGVTIVPLRAALWLGRRLGEVAYYAVYPRTKIALEQIATAMPELPRSKQRATIRDMYRQFAQGVVEFLRLPHTVATGRLDQLVAVDGEDIVRKAYAQGKGLLILTAHYGNFELLSTFFAAHGYQVNLVTRRLKNGALDRFWAEQRRRLKIRAIFKEQSLREVIARLRRNEAMGYVLDQNMGPGQGVFVNFFGRSASTLGVVAVLAKRFDSPVIPVFITRDPSDPTRHRIVFESPVPFESKGDDKSDADIVDNTQRYTAIIERRVRERPDHWIWIHKRWKTRPPQKTG